MKKKFTEAVVTIIKFVGNTDEPIVTANRCYTRDQIRKACYDAIQPSEALSLNIGLIVEVDINCYNRSLDVDESVLFTKEFSGKTAILEYKGFMAVLDANLGTDYDMSVIEVTDLQRRSSKSLTIPRKISMSADLLKQKVLIGRDSFPVRGKTMKKRPMYSTMRMVFEELGCDPKMFIEHYSTRMKVNYTTVLTWYKLMMAVCYGRVPRFEEWPGNDVMLKHYANKDPYKYLRNKYRVSRSVLVIWFELIKEVLQHYPEVSVTAL
jgi:hypothetical protein